MRQPGCVLPELRSKGSSPSLCHALRSAAAFGRELNDEVPERRRAGVIGELKLESGSSFGAEIGDYGLKMNLLAIHGELDIDRSVYVELHRRDGGHEAAMFTDVLELAADEPVLVE